jgi:hypothetical protein
MQAPWPRVAALLLVCGGLSTLWACTDDNANDDASDSNQACEGDEDCEGGYCDVDAGTCVEATCNPSSETIGPMPRDEVGGECCTEKPGCTGYDRMGETVNPIYTGETLACEGGVWVEDPTYCEGVCQPGTSYFGCVWNSQDGDYVRPECGCRPD